MATILEQDAEPVGGWWPDDVGEPVVRVEGPMHPRVGTVVVDLEDAAELPNGTIAECEPVRFGHAFLVRSNDDGWVDVQQMGARYEQTLVSSLYIIGATILYVPTRTLADLRMRMTQADHTTKEAAHGW